MNEYEYFDEDLADAIRCGSLVECPYLRGLVHCDGDCKNCDDCLDNDNVDENGYATNNKSTKNTEKEINNEIN